MKISMLSLLVLLLLTAATAHAGAWEDFKSDFVSADGRVIDRANGDISHSEGQGYAMLLAVAANDRQEFETLWNWTRNNLQIRGIDALLAWKWGQRSTGEWTVVDLNNATDGDLLVAWALLRAGRLWSNQQWLDAAHALASQVVQRLRIHWQGLDLLLPGYFGFDQNGYALNPSYLLFPAYAEFAQAWTTEKQQWDALTSSGLALLERCRMTSLTLPPDWVLLAGDQIRIDTSRSPWFGYDAIRVPLYLAMAGDTTALTAYGPLLDLIDRLGYVPRQVDLDRSTVHWEAGPAGFWAVLAGTARSLGRAEQAGRLQKRANELVRNEKTDYYSRVLYLLASPNFPAHKEKS